MKQINNVVRNMELNELREMARTALKDPACRQSLTRRNRGKLQHYRKGDLEQNESAQYWLRVGVRAALMYYDYVAKTGRIPPKRQPVRTKPR